MIVNSAKEYRTQIKNDKYRPDVDEDFMGYSHGSKENHKYGFFNLFHGIKKNIFLLSWILLKITKPFMSSCKMR